MKPGRVRASLLSDLPDEREEQVLGILEEYLAELECGGRPSPEDWIARHPDMEHVLRAYLRELDQLHQAGPPKSFPASEDPAGAGRWRARPVGRFSDHPRIGRGGMGVVYGGSNSRSTGGLPSRCCRSRPRSTTGSSSTSRMRLRPCPGAP